MSSWDVVQPPFEAYLAEAGLATSTIKFYSRDLKAFFRWYESEYGLTANPAIFCSADIEAYKEHLMAGCGHSPATINRNLQSLRKFGQFRSQTFGQVDNAAGAVRLAKLPAVVSAVVLSPEQQAALMQRAGQRTARQAHRDCLIFRLLLATGMRARELSELRHCQLDLGREQVQILDESSSGRTLPLSPDLVEALITYCAAEGITRESYLFPGREGRPMSVRMVQKLITTLGRDCGFELSVKVLRNSYAHRLWQESGDLDLLTERMGYRSETSALRHVVVPRLIVEVVDNGSESSF